MINQRSVDAVDRSTFSSNFRKPLYESYCFANIPGTVERALTGTTTLRQLPPDVLPDATYDKVVVFFVDAFGWRFFERYKDKYPILQRFMTDGVVSKITSQFPSTTAAHVTTIHTGKRVDESGVFEWFYYEPKVDAMIAPLPFSYAGDTVGNTLASSIDPAAILPHETFYSHLQKSAMRTHIFQPPNAINSMYHSVVARGATHTHPYTDLPSALTDLSQAVKEEGGKAYFYFYFGDIDGAGHVHGPDSEEFTAAVDTFFTELESVFVTDVQGNCGKTCMLMTADHGQANTDPETTIYLNKALPKIVDWIQTNANGDLLVPGGSCRDLFLYIKDECLDVATRKITTLLDGRAEVHQVADLLDQGFFGDAPSDTLKSRLGNLCILPYQHESVFWWDAGRFEQNYYGHHGGLTPEEMDSIFLTLEL